jgi:hypothetical protein
MSNPHVGKPAAEALFCRKDEEEMDEPCAEASMSIETQQLPVGASPDIVVKKRTPFEYERRDGMFNAFSRRIGCPSTSEVREKSEV